VVFAQRRLAAERDRPIARLIDSTRPRTAPRQTLAVNQTWSNNADGLQANAPDQAVLPVTVSKVLVHVPLIGLGQIVSNFSRDNVGGKDRRAVLELQRDVAAQTDRH